MKLKSCRYLQYQTSSARDAAHDSHSSFIKTPKQLSSSSLLAFLVPILGIILLVQLVTQPAERGPQRAHARIRGRAHPAGGPNRDRRADRGAAGARTGEAIVKTTCAACHQAGVANAPKIGDERRGRRVIKEGLKGMLANAIKGKGAMPPSGGDTSLTDDEVARAVVFMANQSGGKLKEPAAPKEAAKPAAPQQQAQAAPAEAKPAPAPAKPVPDSKPAAESKPAAGSAEGKAVYEKVCFACHAQGLAGAPKLGDKEAWATARQAGHGHAGAVGHPGQRRDAAQGGQPLAHRRRAARGCRIHGLAEQVAWSSFSSSIRLRLKAYKDTSVSMMRAAQARGHAVLVCEQAALHWAKSSVNARATRLSAHRDDDDWYRAARNGAAPAQRVRRGADAQGPAVRHGVRVPAPAPVGGRARGRARCSTSRGAIRDHNEKLAIAEFAQFTAPTLVTRDAEDAAGVHRRAPATSC